MFLSNPFKTLPNSLFYWATTNVNTCHSAMSYVLCALSKLSSLLSCQPESVLHSSCLYFLVPIGWLCLSIQSPVAAGVVLGVIGVQPVLHPPLFSGKWGNLPMLVWWNSCTTCNPVSSRAILAAIGEGLVSTGEWLVPIKRAASVNTSVHPIKSELVNV